MQSKPLSASNLCVSSLKALSMLDLFLINIFVASVDHIKLKVTLCKIYFTTPMHVLYVYNFFDKNSRLQCKNRGERGNHIYDRC